MRSHDSNTLCARQLLHDYITTPTGADTQTPAPPLPAAVGGPAKGQVGKQAKVSGGMSTDTGDLAAGGGAGRVLQPRKWVGALEDSNKGKQEKAEGAHSMACGDSEEEEGVEMIAAPSNFTPFAAGEGAGKHACACL